MIRALPIIAAIILISVAFCGCATTPGPIQTQTVNVPVPVHCKPNLSPTPTFPDTSDALKAATDIFEQTKLLLAGRDLRSARIVELEAAVRGCE